MKKRIILSALFVVMLALVFNTNAGAAPWRHCGYGYGYCRPVVRYCPPVRVYVPPVVVGGYYGPHYYAPHYYRHGYYR